MNGSASLKSVLPVFEPGLDYGDLAIQDGGSASIVYLNILRGIFGEVEKQKALGDLREYCLVDTLEMVKAD